MSDKAGSGALVCARWSTTLSRWGKLNEALDDELPALHGGFSNFVITPDQALLNS